MPHFTQMSLGTGSWKRPPIVLAMTNICLKPSLSSLERFGAFRNSIFLNNSQLPTQKFLHWGISSIFTTLVKSHKGIESESYFQTYPISNNAPPKGCKYLWNFSLIMWFYTGVEHWRQKLGCAGSARFHYVSESWVFVGKVLLTSPYNEHLISTGQSNSLCRGPKMWSKPHLMRPSFGY